MDIRLIEAAEEGDVEKLLTVVRDNPSVLLAAALSDGDNPLHIACIEGHVDFVKVALDVMPEFVNQLNQYDLSPLHIASAKGHLEIVKQLLKQGTSLCLVMGKDMRIALHYAVMRGKIPVIRELVSAQSDSLSRVTAQGENCFHMAVKSNQFEAFQLLLELLVKEGKQDILNDKDVKGNTILHLAASRRQYEVFDLLLDESTGWKEKLEINALNKDGLTPLDVLISQGGNSEIENMLCRAGAQQKEDVPRQNLLVVSEDPPHNRSKPQQSAGD